MSQWDNTNEEKATRPQVDTVNAEIPLLGKFSGSGIYVVVIILIATIVSGFAWFLKTHDETTHSVIRELRILQYVTTLSQEKRDALNLNMPDELRDRIKYR